jgi:small subunit ribosomal protein S20
MGSAGTASLLRFRTPAQCGPFFDMANIQQQKKRVGIAERQRAENLRYRSTVKTLTKRLEAAAAAGEDPDKVAAEHLELVRTIDKAAARGALHKNTAARKKARAARVAAASGT